MIDPETCELGHKVYTVDNAVILQRGNSCRLASWREAEIFIVVSQTAVKSTGEAAE